MPKNYDDFDESVDLYSVSGTRHSGNSRAARRKKKKSNPVRVIINTVASIVLIASILMLTGTVLLGSRPMQRQNEEEPGLYEELLVSKHSEVSYVLVVGLDESESLTDIMMVACVDHERGTMNILQIPRDTFVGTSVPSGKLNAVYANSRDGESHINALRRRISSNLGIPIDHYVIFTLPAFRNVVDALGGVTMTITQKNGIVIEDHTQPIKPKLTIGPGEVTLNGMMAEGFVRKRYGSEEGYGNGDLSRVQQQRIFYAAVAKKMKDMSLSQMLTIATSCYDEVQTSMSVSEMLAYAKEVQALDLDQMQIMTTPGSTAWFNDLSYFSIRRNEYIEMYNTYFNPYGDPLTEEEVTIPDLVNYLGQTYYGNIMTEGGSLSDIYNNNEGLGGTDAE